MDDGSSLSSIQFSVDEKNYTIGAIQPSKLKLPFNHAVFLIKDQESVIVNHEREPDDPLVTHTLDLDSDAYGSVFKSISISYGRKETLGSMNLSYWIVEDMLFLYKEKSDVWDRYYFLGSSLLNF